MTEADQYDFWRRRLAGEIPDIHDGDAQAGFYRIRFGEEWKPVAYWYTKAGALRCRVADRDATEQWARERWSFASQHPITHEVYQAVVAGGPWPDQHEAVTRDRLNSQGAPDPDSFDGLKDRIADLARDAETLIKAGGAKSQEEADRASDLANRLGELWNKADGARKIEKTPFDEKAKAVQAKWLPVLSTAEIYKRIKAAVVTPFLVAQENKRRVAEAEARRMAEEAAKKNEPIPEPPPAATVPIKAGAAGRRSVSLRTVKAIEITDRAAVLAFFIDNEAITDVLQDLAAKAMRAGVTVPGTKVTETQTAA